MIQNLNVGLEPLQQGWLNDNWQELRADGDRQASTRLFVDLGNRCFLMLGVDNRWSGCTMSLGNGPGERVAPFYPLATGKPHFTTVETAVVEDGPFTTEVAGDLLSVYKAFVAHAEQSGHPAPIDFDGLAGARLDIHGHHEAEVNMHLVPESQIRTGFPISATWQVGGWESQFTPWSSAYDGEQLYLVSLQDMFVGHSDVVQLFTPKPVYIGQV